MICINCNSFTDFQIVSNYDSVFKNASKILKKQYFDLNFSVKTSKYNLNAVFFNPSCLKINDELLLFVNQASNENILNMQFNTSCFKFNVIGFLLVKKKEIIFILESELYSKNPEENNELYEKFLEDISFSSNKNYRINFLYQKTSDFGVYPVKLGDMKLIVNPACGSIVSIRKFLREFFPDESFRECIKAMKYNYENSHFGFATMATFDKKNDCYHLFITDEEFESGSLCYYGKISPLNKEIIHEKKFLPFCLLDNDNYAIISQVDQNNNLFFCYIDKKDSQKFININKVIRKFYSKTVVEKSYFSCDYINYLIELRKKYKNEISESVIALSQSEEEEKKDNINRLSFLINEIVLEKQTFYKEGIGFIFGDPENFIKALTNSNNDSTDIFKILSEI